MLGLIALPSALLACAAMSVVESRLKGSAVWWTASHATAFTRAWSSGGKSDLPASPRRIFHVEHPMGPASPPVPHGVGMEVHLCGRMDMGQEGDGMQEQHQCGAL